MRVSLAQSRSGARSEKTSARITSNRDRRDDRLSNIQVMTWAAHALEHERTGDYNHPYDRAKEPVQLSLVPEEPRGAYWEAA